MSLVTNIQKVIDQLMYNQLYAPDYPSEDCTNLERQAMLVDEVLAQLVVSERMEDVDKWLRQGSRSVAIAFEKYRNGDEKNARKDIEDAIEYLRNACSHKKRKASYNRAQWHNQACFLSPFRLGMRDTKCKCSFELFPAVGMNIL